MKYIFLVLAAFSAAFSSMSAYAWGKRGHQAICETAALLVSNEPNARFMKARAFDFGYYCNVPDFIWKRDKTYAMERPQHYMDLEIYDAAFKQKPEIKKPMDLSRAEFVKAFPEVTDNAGRAFWRVREFNDMITPLTEKLKSLPDEKKKEKQEIQGKWLTLVGVMGHYIGDLAQPLHTTESHDGQKTDQRGIHFFYEEEVVDELFPKFRVEVQDQATKRWPKFHKDSENKTLNEIMEQLARSSYKDIDPLLAIDRKVKRDSAGKVAEKYRKLIVKQMVEGSLALAEIYHRQLGFKFDNDKFYFMNGEPEFVPPPAEAKADVAPKK